MGILQKESVIFVGNGGSLLNKGLGYKIDKFDKIIRVNNWKTYLHENDSGTKTKIWITYNPTKQISKFIRDYKGFDFKDDEIKELVSDLEEVWYISWRSDNINYNWEDTSHLKWLGIYNNVLKRHISNEYANNINKLVNIPSTGFMSLLTLLETYDKIYMTGIDFWGRLFDSEFEHYYKTGKKSHHYSIEEVNKRPNRFVKGGFVHNPDIEASIIKDYMNEGRIINLEKNTKIEKSEIITNETNYTCNRCNSSSRLYSWENTICHRCENI